MPDNKGLHVATVKNGAYTKFLRPLSENLNISLFLKNRNNLSSTNLNFDSYKRDSFTQDKSIVLHNSPSTKEWANSIYAYNKNYIKTLPSARNLANQLIRDYFSIDPLINGKKSKVRKILKKRATLNRIFVSKTEIKHTNKKVNLTVYIYNRSKITLLSNLKKLKSTLNLIRFNGNELNRNKFNNVFKSNIFSSKRSNSKLKKSFINYYKLFTFDLNNKENNINNTISHSNFSLSKRYSYKINLYPNDKALTSLLKLNKKIRFNKNIHNFKTFSEKGLLLLNKTNKFKENIIKTLNTSPIISKETFYNYENKYYSKYVSKYYLNEALYLYYIKLLLFNTFLFNNNFLSSLKRNLSKLYNKKVELNIVNQKYFYLNSDIFTKALSTRVRNRKNAILRHMRKALSGVGLPDFDPYKVKKTIVTSNEKGINVNYKIFQKSLINSIKYKYVHGIRLQAAGRLSRRLTAARSVFKLGYKGNLRNTDLITKSNSIVMLRGNVKPNVQYTNINSKTRNGAFGLKGWISNN